MKRKIQILLVHGGMTFSTHKGYMQYLRERPILIEKKQRWSGDYLDKKLGRGYEIIRPRMPLSENANYEEWRVHFERHIPLLRSGVVLVGVSLGAIFLAKYLSKKRFAKKIRAVILIAPPFDSSLPDEELVGGFNVPRDLSHLSQQTNNLHLFFSADDETVPVAHAEKYRAKLPSAHITIYKSKGGHFHVATFPEVVALIKGLC